MKIIDDNCINEIIIKNSRFICYLIKIESTNISDILNNIKYMHPKATHYCYGFIYDEVKKSSDDGEPGGTAGMPILNVLEKENLNHILAVVVRYFGGIKLGAGGLVRAYTKAVTETLKTATYNDLIKGYKISLSFDYQNEKNINYILKDMDIVTKKYDKLIYYEALINRDILVKLEKYNPTIINECYIENKK